MVFLILIYQVQLIYILLNSGIPEAEVFGRKRKFSLFGLRFRLPNIKAEYGRKSNFRIFLDGLLNSRKYCTCKLTMVTKQICSNVKFFINLNTKVISKINWIKYQNCTKKLHTYLLKTLETLSCSKIPPTFTYICTFGFGFGIRPKARYFSGQIFGFGLKWKTYFRSFTGAKSSSL